MNTIEPLSEPSQIAVKHGDRWQVYHRLQELEIPCQYAVNQPLEVEIPHATAAMQLWSVVKQISAPRHELVQWLETCWQISAN